MNSSNPILVHKFWILLVLAIILPTVGYFMATGDYAKYIEDRRTALEASFNSVNVGANAANTEWVSHARALVEAEQKQMDAAQDALMTSQEKKRDWPSGVASYMVNVPQRGNIHRNALEAYRSGYGRYLQSVESVLRPYNLTTGEGVILYDRGSVTHLLPDTQWKSLPPKSAEMWDAQEDLWLTRSVFESIASVNRVADKLGDAPVREILQFTLRGGQRNYSSATATAGTEGATDTSMESMYSTMPQSSETGQTGALQIPEISFDLSDELGPDGSGSSGAMYTTETADASTAGPSAASGPKRYVDDADDLPFKTRAFVLGVYMDHRQLNTLLAALSQSEWPLQVIRVNQAMINVDELAEATSRTRPGRPGAMSTTGYPGTDEMTGVGARRRPVGNRGNRNPGMENMMRRPGDGDTTTGLQSQAAQHIVNQAMQDPYLAEVWIGGLITLFKPLEKKPEDGSSPTTTTPPQTVDASLTAEDPAATPETTTEPTGDAATESPTTPEPTTTDPGDAPPSESAPPPAPENEKTEGTPPADSPSPAETNPVPNP